MDDDGAGALTLTPEAGVRLLIQLQRPGEAEPDQRRTTLLEVQAVSGSSRMDQRDRDFPRVPVADVLRGADLAGLREAGADPVEIVPEPVRDQDGPAVRGFEEILEGIELVTVEGNIGAR